MWNGLQRLAGPRMAAVRLVLAEPQSQGRGKTGRNPATDVRQVCGESVRVSAEEL